MAHMMDKVKHALGADKHTSEAETANKGSNEYGSAEPHVGETKPGILHSTERGIHGDRDPGTGVMPGGFGTSGTTGQQYDSTSSTTGQDFPEKEGLYSGTGTSRDGVPPRHPGHIADTNTTNPTDLTGTGSGYDSNNRDRGIVSGTGAGLGSRSDDERSLGNSGTAGPHNSNLLNKVDPRVDSDRDGSRNAGMTGATRSGGNDPALDRSIQDRDTTGIGDTSGHQTTGRSHNPLSSVNIPSSGLGYDDSSTTSGTGLTSNERGYGNDSTGVGPGTGLGSGTGIGSGTAVGSGKKGGDGQHRPGDGDPIDIVHPGAHHTETANKLDPHIA